MLRIGVILAIAAVALTLSLVLSSTSGAVWSSLFYLTPIAIVVGVVLAFKKGPRQSALLAIALAYTVTFAFVIGSSIIFGIPDDTKRSSCEMLCLNRTENFIFRLFIAAFTGTIIAVPSAIVAAILARKDSRNLAAQ